MRAHVGKRLAVLHLVVFGGQQAQTFLVFTDQHFTLMRAAMKQVHVAQKAIHKGAGRVVPHLLRRADLLDYAGVHQHHAVRHLQRLFLVVGDKNAGHMQIVMQAAQPAAQFLAHLGIQRTKRLIEQQHLRLHRQGTSQGNALALSARELRRVAVCQPVQLHQAQQVMHLLLDHGLRGSCCFGFHAQAKGHVVKHTHVAKQRVMLKHKAHVALAHVFVGGVCAVEQDVPLVSSFQPGDDAQQRGLAAARGAQQGDKFAGFDGQ